MGKAVAEKTVKKPPRSYRKLKSSKEARSQTRFFYYSIAALVLVVVLCYANSLGNQFVFDDHRLVVRHRWPQSFDEALRMLYDSYRPLRQLSYAFDLALWGKNPFGFHLVNTLIHAINVVLVFLLIRRLTGGIRPSLVTALIFAVHPMQSDSVAYISGRRDVLFAMFYIAAFYFYLKWRDSRRRRHLALFIAMWASSLLSKEMAISLPLVIFLWSFSNLWGEMSGSRIKRTGTAIIKALAADKWLYTMLLAASVAYTCYYIFIRHASSRVGTEGIYFWGGSFYTNLLMAIRAQAWYLKQLVFPTPTAQYYGAFELSSSIFEWKVLLAIFVAASVIGFGFALLNKNRLMAFALLAYFAMLLPVSQIVPHHEFVADHYLYLPVASFALIVALGVEVIAKRRPNMLKPACAAVGAVIVVFATMTILNNRTWKDDFTLWQTNYNAVPRSPRAATNLAAQYANTKGDLQKAEYYLKQALASDPAYEAAYSSLNDLYIAQKRYDKAEEILRQGLDVAQSGGRSFITVRKPRLFHSQITSAMGALKKAQGDTEAAEQLLREAIRLQADNLEPYAILANLYHDIDHMKEIEVLGHVLVVKPRYYEILVRIASLLVENKRYDEAIIYANRALSLTPDDNECNKASNYLESARRLAAAANDDTALTDVLMRLEQQCAR